MKPIDVDPLDEERWKRVERGVFRALDEHAPQTRARPVRGWALGFAGAALAAGLSVFGYLRLATRDEEPTLSAGAAPPPSSAAVELRVASGEAPVEQAWGKLAVRAEPRSLLTLDTPRGALHRGRLESGAVRIAVPAGEQLELTVGRVLVRASAVRFVASYDGYRPELTVEEGELALAGVGLGGPSVLRAGERWPAGEAAAPLPSAQESTTHEDLSASATPQLERRAPGARSGTTAPTARERYEQAARMEGTDPRQAEALYRALARGRGAWSAHALFALGRLELERGQTAGGRATLRRYLARHPGGPNAEDARRLLAAHP